MLWHAWSESTRSIPCDRDSLSQPHPAANCPTVDQGNNLHQRRE